MWANNASEHQITSGYVTFTNNNTKMFNYQVCLQKIKIQRRNFIFYLKIPIFSFENVKIKLREPYDFLNNIS